MLDGPGWDRLLARVVAVPDVGSASPIGCEFRLGEQTPAADLFVVSVRGARLRGTISAGVDVTPAGLLPRLGLELYHAGSWRNSRDGWLRTGRADWSPVVERLALRGWCLGAKAQGLLEWCALDKMYDRRGVFHVYKGINHVKLTITDAGVGAKAYAGMTYALAQDRPASGPLTATGAPARH